MPEIESLSLAKAKALHKSAVAGKAVPQPEGDWGSAIVTADDLLIVAFAPTPEGAEHGRDAVLAALAFASESSPPLSEAKDEIRRLQQCARELAELSLAKGKADAASPQPPTAVPAEPMQANAGPAPGDRPIDRLIAAQPLPKYPYAKPAQPTDADKRDAERWQPIDNAPKDGRHILVWWENEARLAWWLDNSKTRTPWAGWKVPSLQVMPFGSAPTHWMPLPSKPPDAAIAASAKEAK